MNNANAVGFVFFGAVMWLMPILVPGWFPHTAIDGSSARALWVATVGLSQFLIGASILVRRGYVVCLEGVRRLIEQRGAVATADWQGEALPTNVVVVDFAQPGPFILTMPEARFPSRRTVTLAGVAAARWLALGRSAAGQARVTNLVGRPGNAGQAA